MLWECDVLVIGGGGAAVRAAISAAEGGVNVLMVDKGRFERSGTSPLGLHGFATVYHEDDSPDILAQDIVKTGSTINDLDLVFTAVQASHREAELLQNIGMRFVHLSDGNLDIYQGSGHSAPHGITFDEKANGINVVAVLGKEAWKKGVKLVEEVMIVELFVDNGIVLGALGIDNLNQTHVFSAKSVILASGGANGLYPNVTPRIAHKMYRTTGDGYALALRAGLALIDMEFANFRDTPPLGRLGGTLVNSLGESVMDKYAPEKGGSATRGKIVEAIYLELRAGNGPLVIEIDSECERRAEFLAAEYKTYVRSYKEGRRPPVSITFQRLLGGARINSDTSNEISGLYVAGENSGGFHGADRLQGAAFLETQVFGRLAGEKATEFALIHDKKQIPQGMINTVTFMLSKIKINSSGPKAEEILKKIQHIAWKSAGIVRQAGELELALAEIITLRESLNEVTGNNCIEVLEVANLAVTAEVVIRAALAREETRGTHRRSDFPMENPALAQHHIQVTLGSDQQLRVDTVARRDLKVI